MEKAVERIVEGYFKGEDLVELIESAREELQEVE
ncbi:hypothetical protein EUAN_12550 [Andreesenia angusta]|uniref:Uncharacterized protein n=1 Tax=Andreesenia angusta TaxID=39480 RepID=A0A1S1V6B8_9FIRM|nr:hypothetical protein EUAN_12550 [Andreesenia angusta]